MTQQHHRELLPVLKRCVPRDGVVFDVGAHAGQFTKLFARLAVDGRVCAIEPGSYAGVILRTAIAVHRLANVQVVPVALGANERPETLNIPLKASGAVGFGLSHLGGAETRWPGVATEAVVQTTVDALVATLALDRLDFIKADIEGGELRMLEGARQSLERFRPRLLLEVTAAHLARVGDTVAEVFGFFAAHDYRAFALSAKGALVAASAPSDGDFWFFPADDLLVLGSDG